LASAGSVQHFGEVAADPGVPRARIHAHPMDSYPSLPASTGRTRRLRSH
jgi:hypothetical protein